jgi:hypothetical protein
MGDSSSSRLPAADIDVLDSGNLLLQQDPALDPTFEQTPQLGQNQLVNLGLFEQLPSFELIDKL